MPNTHLLKLALGHVQGARNALIEYVGNAPRDSEERIAMLDELAENARAIEKLENFLGRMVIAERSKQLMGR